MSDRDIEYKALEKAIDGINDSVKVFSVKMDGLSSIIMSVNNELARLDERVTNALREQAKHSSDIQDIKSRLGALESFDESSSKIRELLVKIILILLSSGIGALVMHFATQ